jgi:hypothetical protein
MPSKFTKRSTKHASEYEIIHYSIASVPAIAAAFYVTMLNILSTITETIKRSSVVRFAAAASLYIVSTLNPCNQSRDPAEL